MVKSLPPLNALRAFEVAARYSSFTRAAAELNVSHSSISRHVRGLELRLGSSLFVSEKRGVKLTDLGQVYYAEISPALNTIARATDRLFSPSGDIVKISCEPYFAQHWFAQRLFESQFQKDNPHIEIELTSTEDVVDVQRGDCDIAIRFFPAGKSAEEGIKLMDTQVHPFAAPGFAGLDPASLDLDRFAKQKTLCWPSKRTLG